MQNCFLRTLTEIVKKDYSTIFNTKFLRKETITKVIDILYHRLKIYVPSAWKSISKSGSGHPKVFLSTFLVWKSIFEIVTGKHSLTRRKHA